LYLNLNTFLSIAFKINTKEVNIKGKVPVKTGKEVSYKNPIKNPIKRAYTEFQYRVTK
jgi:hypothetical protein